MIPPFTDEGILPRGRYAATPEELEQRFVMTFPASMTRGGLYDGWRRRREEIVDTVEIESEWIDGSFVTVKSNAGDIDIVTLVREDVINDLEISERKRLSQLVSGPHSQLVFGCDSYLLIVRDENDPNYGEYVWWRGYWDRWWSKYGGQPDRKGYLEVPGDV